MTEDDGTQLDIFGNERPWRDARAEPRATRRPEPTPDILTVREVADLARLSTDAVYRAVRRGDLVAFEPVPGRLRIRRADYDSWWESRRVTPVSRAGPRVPPSTPMERTPRRKAPSTAATLDALRGIEREARR